MTVMKPEQGVVSQTARVEMGVHLKLNSNGGVKKRKGKRITVKREFPIRLLLQEFYASCKAVFNGPAVVPSPTDVQSICKVLDRMELEDLGLSKKLQFFNPGNAVDGNQRVMCSNIYKCKDFSLDLFAIPASAVIPLHNHPGMTVFSKLLSGQMHVKSYDWVDSENSKQPSGLRLAKLKADTVLTSPCDTKILFPTMGGNIHQLTAITPCLVLDVLGPPYSTEDDRDCTIYRDLPYDANADTKLVDPVGDDVKYGWLEEIETPEEARMVGIKYMGPPVIENIW